MLAVSGDVVAAVADVPMNGIAVVSDGSLEWVSGCDFEHPMLTRLASGATKPTSVPLAGLTGDLAGGEADLVAPGVDGDLYTLTTNDFTSAPLARVGADGRAVWERDAGAPIADSPAPALLAGPLGVYVQAGITTTLYAAADGAPRWGVRGPVWPDDSGSFGTLSENVALATAAGHITSYDEAMATRWTKTFTASATVAPTAVWVGQPRRTAGGSILTIVSYRGDALDLGDRVITAGDDPATLVVAIDGTTAATRWAFAVPADAAAGHAPWKAAVSGEREVLVRGGDTLELVIVGGDGVERDDVLAVPDPPYQVELAGIAPAADGSLWMWLDVVETYGAETQQARQLELAGMSFCGHAHYAVDVAL